MAIYFVSSIPEDELFGSFSSLSVACASLTQTVSLLLAPKERRQSERSAQFNLPHESLDNNRKRLRFNNTSNLRLFGRWENG